jgi:hypothetical protein
MAIFYQSFYSFGHRDVKTLILTYLRKEFKLGRKFRDISYAYMA